MRVMIAIYLAAMLICFAISACNNENYSGSSTSGPDRNSLCDKGPNSNSPIINTSAMNSDGNSSNTASVQDEFWTEAAEGGMAEVELVELVKLAAGG